MHLHWAPCPFQIDSFPWVRSSEGICRHCTLRAQAKRIQIFLLRFSFDLLIPHSSNIPKSIRKNSAKVQSVLFYFRFVLYVGSEILKFYLRNFNFWRNYQKSLTRLGLRPNEQARIVQMMPKTGRRLLVSTVGLKSPSLLYNPCF